MIYRFLGAVATLSMIAFGSGCVTISSEGDESTRNSMLTAGVAKAKIIKGQTTQAEILSLFGAPNIITKDKQNDEVWNYNRMSFSSVVDKDSYATFFFLSGFGGSRAVSTATTKSFDLIVTFDENDVVKSYSIISASF